MKLNLGCGRNILPDWVNVDSQALPGVDMVADLDNLLFRGLPVGDDLVDEMLASHLIEHLEHPLRFMQELHRVAKPGAELQLRVPYGSSDDAWEDPTHKRPYFMSSWAYFAQPLYTRADYGYRGDWDCYHVRLFVDAKRYAGKSAALVLAEAKHLRNVVLEMHAFMRAVKPVRANDPTLFGPPALEIIATTPGQPDVVLT